MERGEAYYVMRKALVVMSLLMAGLVATAGTLSGVIKEKSTEITLPNARVAVLGTTYSTIANIDGVYKFNIPDGTYQVRVYFSGFTPETQSVTVSGDTELDFDLVASAIEEEIEVTANRAMIRETPVAFTNVTGEKIKERYTSQDTPELLKSVPGVFARSTGLGESDLFIRGFDSERVQIMINNVPVNDPESQVVYWSNWTGLSGNAGSIQVQRGVGSSLYGSGAFGGSVNIETDNFSVEPSSGFTGTFADISGNNHYVGALDYSTGFFNNDKMNLYARYERKDGDSYIDGTDYDGHSFYIGTLYQVSDVQSWTINLHGAPQEHNQAADVQDPAILANLNDRQWNRRNHPYQENYYFKPVFEAHHNWTLSSRAHWRSTLFLTSGDGGGRYLRNDRVQYNRFWIGTEQEQFNTGRIQSIRTWDTFTQGQALLDDSFTGDNNFRDPFRDYTPARSMFNNSWRNDSQNIHDQFGGNTSYKVVMNEQLTFVTGGEVRVWTADHYADTEDFEYGEEPSVGLGDQNFDSVERRYDYVGDVENFSVYARMQYNPTENVTIMGDLGYLSFDQSIDENPLRQWDFYNRRWTDIYARATRDISSNWDASGATTTADVIANPDAPASLYSRSYDFIQPKLGVNWNIDDASNLFFNLSRAYKEPQVGDWYTRSSVPLSEQDLQEETLTDFEIGYGFRTRKQNLSINVYHMIFEDRIERVRENDESFSSNVGEAIYEGVEVAYSVAIDDNFSATASLSLADNTWEEQDRTVSLGGETFDPGELVGLHVPGSPEQTFFGEVNYNSRTWNAYANVYWWDSYYTNWSNDGFDDGELLAELGADSTLPNLFEVGIGVTYSFRTRGGSSLDVGLRGYNITGHEHFVGHRYGRDFGRIDGSGPYVGVAQAPEESFFMTLDWRF